MTMTVSHISQTTPRLWVMSKIAVLSFFWRSFKSSRTCACTVTSRAVVGSSAMMGEEWWFILRDIPAEELEQMALKAQLDYLSMMVDPEL